MFGFMGVTLMFYIQIYALTRGVTSYENHLFDLHSILNASSFVGRVIPNLLAGMVGPMNMLDRR